MYIFLLWNVSFICTHFVMLIKNRPGVFFSTCKNVWAYAAASEFGSVANIWLPWNGLYTMYVDGGSTSCKSTKPIIWHLHNYLVCCQKHSVYMHTYAAQPNRPSRPSLRGHTQMDIGRRTHTIVNIIDELFLFGYCFFSFGGCRVYKNKQVRPSDLICVCFVQSEK